MPATIRDLAEMAGVSAATVSRAFSRPEKVGAATRLRILTLAAEIGYEPSSAARSLKTGRTGALGIIVPDLSNPFFPDVVRGMQHRAREYGYPVLLADSAEDPAAEVALVRTLARNVDAIVLCSPRMSDDELVEAAQLRPVVLINRETPAATTSTVPAVTIDNAGGIEHAVRHLRDLGHRRIGFVSSIRTSRSNEERLVAFTGSTAAAGLDGVVIGRYQPTVEGGAAAADDALTAAVTAVVVFNDIMAAGLMARLSRLGVTLPDQMSVVGFDDISLSALLTPALTTVRLPLELAGSVAVDRLHAHLTGVAPSTDRPASLPTELIVRDSTAALTAAALRG